MNVAPGFRPLYRQVYDLLVRRIAEGAWRPAEALPSEQALAAELGVSQGTVRKALDALASDYHPAAMMRAALAVAEAELTPLHRAVVLVTAAPAQAVGLDDRGAIEVGRRADLTMVEQRPAPRIRATVCGGRFIHAETHAAVTGHPRAPLGRPGDHDEKPRANGGSQLADVIDPRSAGPC